MITETTDANTAVALLIAMYNIFEIKFSKNNRTARLLYGILTKDTHELGKNLRLLLHEWEFPLTDQNFECHIPHYSVHDDGGQSHVIQTTSTAATTTEVYYNTTKTNHHGPFLSTAAPDDDKSDRSFPVPLSRSEIEDIDEPPPLVIAMEVVMPNETSTNTNEENGKSSVMSLSISEFDDRPSARTRKRRQSPARKPVTRSTKRKKP